MTENNFKKQFDPHVTGKHRRSDKEILEYSESQVISNRFQGNYTICDIHRLIYKLVQDDNSDKQEALYLLERAYVTAKKMDAKLRMYKHDYDDDWYQQEKKEHNNWLHEIKNSKD